MNNIWYLNFHKMHIQSYEENYKSNFIFRKYTEEEYNWQKIIKDKIEARELTRNKIDKLPTKDLNYALLL